MKIAIFGAGAIGSLVGAYLSKKHNVTLIGRKKFVERVQHHGLIIKGLTTKIIKNISVSEHIDDQYDLVILTVKAYDTLLAIQSIFKDIEQSYLLTLQNGLDNVQIIKKYKQSKLLAGITTHGAFKIEYGRVMHTGRGTTKLGAITSDAVQFTLDTVRAFKECGFGATYVKDIMSEIWIKGAINACINPITAILNIKNGTILKDENLTYLLKKVGNECKDVLEKKRITVDLIKVVKKVITDTTENYSSMVQDLQKGGKTEIDHITKVFIDEGEKYKISTPYNIVMYRLVKSLESRKQ